VTNRARPVVYGAGYSVYVRIVTLTLLEKGVSFDIDPIDVFADGGLPQSYLARHPFGKIPSFSHDGLDLFETTAITRYIDEAFDGPDLQPADASSRARMNMAIGLLDAYAYRAMVWDIFVERVERAAAGSDEARIAAALPVARTCLDTLEQLSPDANWLTGGQMTLADLHAVPMIDYFVQAPEGAAMLDEFPRLARWWRHLSNRTSVATALKRL